MKRREFVKTTGAAVATGLVVAGCGNDVQPAPILPEAITATAGGQLIVNLKVMQNEQLVDHYPDLAPVGGAITIPIQPPPGVTSGLPDAILVVHLSDVQTDPLRYVAMNSACPHAACPLGFSPKDFMVECPCHGSRFTVGSAGSAGCPSIEISNPPAPGPPTAYAINITVDPISGDDSVLTINLSAGAEFSFADHPDLMNTGGVASSACPPVIVVRQDANTAIALSAICTHQSCAVGAMNGQIICPCHGSEFGLDGSVLKGPATRPLAMLPATITPTSIKVG
jgi:Rieske Fe-S protein